MNSLHYILASLRQYRRVHLAVAAGVAVATAVITGALLVGDSVRGSLRDLVLERLGRIDQVLIAEQPFRAALATELQADEAAPLMLVPGTLTSTDGGQSRHATQLSIVGHTRAFWQLGEGGSPAPLATASLAAGPLADDQVAVSRSIATELSLSVGDEILLRVPLADSMPADSALGEKVDTTTSRRFEIAAVLDDQGLERFSLRPSQQQPRNVFVSLHALQDLLELPDRANAVAIVGEQAVLTPTLEDYSVAVSEVSVSEVSIAADDQDNPAPANYVRVTADRLVLPTALSTAVEQTFADAQIQPAITYLANTIQLGERQIPYSTISGVDSQTEIGPLLDEGGQPLVLADDEIVLNDWAADNLQAKVGDEIVIAYYQPETTHGVLREAEPLTLRLKAIVPLRDAEDRPTLASDPKLTPDLPGVTDQRSISDWELPFQLVEEIRKEDEDYWDEHSTTPKAFVSYALAKKLWSTRWGNDSVLRIPTSANISVDEIQQQVQPNPTDMGMTLLPIKAQGLAASQGTTAFEGLFLGFSFFLMASAIMLIALLFRLGVEGRASELGVLATVGWSTTRLRRTWLSEAALVALVGAIVGVAAGVGYARLMIHGLSTWWVAATVTPFLELHISPTSLALGFGIGIAVALMTIAWSLRKMVRLPARQLLAGDCTTSSATVDRAAYRWLPPALIAGALAIGALATQLEGEAQAGAFFGSGALVLTALLIWLRQQLRQPAEAKPQTLSLAGLAARNARRNPARTILSVGLAAVASFLIVALSAFRLAPTEQGTGGFDLIATSDQPLHFDLNTADGRDELGFGSQTQEKLAGAEVYGFRVRAGEDASCLNLYQTAQPQVVGVPTAFDNEQQFGWASLAEETEAVSSPWKLLTTDLGADDRGQPVVPIVLDKNTAVYSLHLGGVGARMTIDDAYGQPVTLEIVGLLANSVLQGKVLMSDEPFVRLFPDASGQQLFMIRRGTAQPTADALSSLLETQLEDYGFDAVSTERQLAGFLAVQNTYLSTFQSLGALGLMLGTLGLAIAQLRSVLERRGELALLRSAGFRRSRLAEMVLGENTVLLLGGLGIGTLAALAAVLPHYFLQAAGTPWMTLLRLLAAVLVAGLLAGWLAVRAAVRAPLLPSLRGD